MVKQTENLEEKISRALTDRPKCGLIMPIAAFGDYPQSHWSSVEEILREALDDAGYEAKLVSQENASGVIHQRIITNLYTNEIVVCDVSARNPNVMFELGMRLAFDKPTIIIKDDDTPFSFDISAIEHIQYPRSLVYSDIVKFKSELSKRVKETAEAAKTDKSYSTFLKHVSGVQPAKIEIQEVPIQQFISQQLDELRLMIEKTNSQKFANPPPSPEIVANITTTQSRVTILVKGISDADVQEIIADLGVKLNISGAKVSRLGSATRISLGMKYNEANRMVIRKVLAERGLNPEDYSIRALV